MAKREHRYYAGLTPEEKAMAKKSEQRGKALADDDPSKYQEWPSDKSFKERGGKTQESKYTKAFHEKYGARRNAKEDAPDYRPFDVRPFWNAEYQNFAECGNCKWWDAYGDGFGHCNAFDFSCKEDHLCDGHPDIVHAINAGEWITGVGLVDSVEVIENPRIKKKAKSGPKSLLNLYWTIDYERSTYGTDYPLQLLNLEHSEYDRGFHVELKYNFSQAGRYSLYDSEREPSASMIIKTKHNLDFFAGYEQDSSMVSWFLPVDAEDNWGEALPAKITINGHDYNGTFEGKYVDEEAQDFLRDYGIMQMTLDEINEIGIRIFEMKQARLNPKVKKKAKGRNRWWEDASWRKLMEDPGYRFSMVAKNIETGDYTTTIKIDNRKTKQKDESVFAYVSHQLGEPDERGSQDVVIRTYTLRPYLDEPAAYLYNARPAGTWWAGHKEDRFSPMWINLKEQLTTDMKPGYKYGSNRVSGYSLDELNKATLSMLNELTYDDILDIVENKAFWESERIKDDDWMLVRNPSKLEFNDMNAQQVQAYATPGWKITKSENWSDQEGTGHYYMEKKYGFENFDDVEDFVKMLNSMITELDHHPEIGYEYDKVVVRTWSHDTKSVSERDYVLSEAVDMLYEDFQNQRKQEEIHSATPYQHEAFSSAHTSGNTDLPAELATLNPKVRKKAKSRLNFEPALRELFSAKDHWKEWLLLPFGRGLSFVIRTYNDSDVTMSFAEYDAPDASMKWELQLTRNIRYPLNRSEIDASAVLKNLALAMNGKYMDYDSNTNYAGYAIGGKNDISETEFMQTFISVMNDLGIPQLRYNPIREGKDDDGHFYRWGKQAKYYFDPKSEKSKKDAYEKSRKQAAAIFSSGYRPKQNPKKKDGDKKKFVAEVSKKTGIKKSILAKVYDKGIAAWGSGHRPGTNPVQWAKARVYAFVEKGGPVFNKKGGKGPDHSLAVEAGLVKAEKNPKVKKKAKSAAKNWYEDVNWEIMDSDKEMYSDERKAFKGRTMTPWGEIGVYLTFYPHHGHVSGRYSTPSRINMDEDAIDDLSNWLTDGLDGYAGNTYIDETQSGRLWQYLNGLANATRNPKVKKKAKSTELRPLWLNETKPYGFWWNGDFMASEFLIDTPDKHKTLALRLWEDENGDFDTAILVRMNIDFDEFDITDISSWLENKRSSTPAWSIRDTKYIKRLSNFMNEPSRSRWRISDGLTSGEKKWLRDWARSQYEIYKDTPSNWKPRTESNPKVKKKAKSSGDWWTHYDWTNTWGYIFDGKPKSKFSEIRQIHIQNQTDDRMGAGDNGVLVMITGKNDERLGGTIFSAGQAVPTDVDSGVATRKEYDMFIKEAEPLMNRLMLSIGSKGIIDGLEFATGIK